MLVELGKQRQIHHVATVLPVEPAEMAAPVARTGFADCLP